MSWSEIKLSYQNLVAALDNDSLSLAWREFTYVVENCPTPYHLLLLLKRCDSLRGGRSRDELVLLDHGCGGGLTLLYLAALGYRNVYGVDLLSSNCERWNLLFIEILGMSKKRFFVYDGTKLPFADKTVDLVFSQQVLEHVHPDVLPLYYQEEARVLREGGVALHSVPHRLVPYESHTNTWFFHCFLGREAWLKFLKLINKSNVTAEQALFLRWPGDHKEMLRKHLGNCEDITIDRIRMLSDFDHYDGPKTLRRVIRLLIVSPIVGKLFSRIISNFMMMDTASIKSPVFR